jgi:hypothetical protein
MMKSYVKQFLKVSILAWAALHFVFCGYSNAVIGKWEQVSGLGLELEFFKDGVVTSGPITGEYRFVESNRVRISLAGLPTFSKTFSVEINRGELLLTPEGSGIALKFKRIK